MHNRIDAILIAFITPQDSNYELIQKQFIQKWIYVRMRVHRDLEQWHN